MASWKDWSEQDWSEQDWSSWEDQEETADSSQQVSGQDWSQGEDQEETADSSQQVSGQDWSQGDWKPKTGTKNDWSHKKRQLNFLHGKDMDALKQQHQQQMTELQQRHDKDMDALKQEHQQQMTELQQRHDAVLRQKQKDLDTIDKAFRDYAFDYAKNRAPGEIEELENQVTEAYEESRQLKASLATADAEIQELKKKIAEHNELNKQHEENKQLKTSLGKAESDLKGLREKAADYEEQNNQLKGKMVDLNNENHRKRKQVAVLMEQVTEVNDFVVGYFKKHHLEKFTKPTQDLGMNT
ncbi:unnamed protein product [Symbiodinium sp. CCMP2592]|nr:unnamed protein product [Symbiodinium sp. CCMP2592]